MKSFIHPGPADEFLKGVPREALAAPMLIGHSRYSTSDLKFNQPIFTDDISVVHNGVITQEPYETWGETWGFQCTGRNDTELILHAMKAWQEGSGEHPLRLFSDSSIAACVLTPDTLSFFRNGKRPLWLYWDGTRTIVTSARNVIVRSMKVDPERHHKCEPFQSIQVSALGEVGITDIAANDFREDLQHDHV